MLIVNGPGLVDLHGCESACTQLGAQLGLSLEFRQTDDLQQFAQWLTQDLDHVDAFVLNPHSSQSTMDATHRGAIEKALAHQGPGIEVHLTNIFADSAASCEPLRPTACDLGLVCGLGVQGYIVAIKALHQRLSQVEAAST